MKKDLKREERSKKAVEDFKNRLWADLTTEENVNKAIKDVSSSFYFLGGLQILLGVIVNLFAIVDGVIFIVLAFLLKKFKSRIVSIILILLSVGVLIITFQSSIGVREGGTNMWLALFMILVSLQAVRATFKYQANKQGQIKEQPVLDNEKNNLYQDQ